MEAIKEWLDPSIIWFVLGLVMVLLEFANPGVVIVFFGIGAWIVAIICLFLDISLNVQLILFLLSSILLLVFLRRRFKDLFHGQASAGQGENQFDDYFGKKAIVAREITASTKGKIEFQGTYWDAESYETIPEGDTVELIDKKNITFTVKPL